MILSSRTKPDSELFLMAFSSFLKRQSKVKARGIQGQAWWYKGPGEVPLPVSTVSLAHYGILSNLFAALKLNCHACYLVVMYYDLPGRALVSINKVEEKHRSCASTELCQIERLILLFEGWFLSPT